MVPKVGNCYTDPTFGKIRVDSLAFHSGYVEVVVSHLDGLGFGCNHVMKRKLGYFRLNWIPYYG